MNQPVVSFIVVNWNGERYLADCLDSIFRQTYTPFEVLVVDNASQDRSLDILKNYPRVQLIRNDKNLGFGPANNLALRIAKGEIVSFVNNDVVLQEDWLKRIVAPIISDATTGMSAGKTLSYDEPQVIDNTGHLLYWDGVNRGRGRSQKDEGQFDTMDDALFPSGCACVFRMEVLREIGSFDEDFFLYGDDTELGIHARLAGWQCAFVPSAVAYHRYSASTSAYNPLKFFFVERNRLWIVFKYFPIELVLLNPFFSLLRYLFHLIALIRGKGVTGEFAKQRPARELLTLWLRAQASGWKSAPRFWRKRREIIRKHRMDRKRFYQCFLPHRLSLKELTFTS